MNIQGINNFKKPVVVGFGAVIELRHIHNPNADRDPNNPCFRSTDTFGFDDTLVSMTEFQFERTTDSCKDGGLEMKPLCLRHFLRSGQVHIISNMLVVSCRPGAAGFCYIWRTPPKIERSTQYITKASYSLYKQLTLAFLIQVCYTNNVSFSFGSAKLSFALLCARGYYATGHFLFFCILE